MKKVLLLTLALCMLVSSFAIAAPSVEHIFSVTENGKVYYYMFGTNDLNATDVGLTINGKDYNLDENALLKAQSKGLFGIGIADPKNILGDSISATPYEVVNGKRDAALEQTIVKAEVADNDVIALNSLTVNGKAVAGFYTGTTETDFYYGLDEITSIESIPQVFYTLSIGEAETSLTEETGGYVYTISATHTGRDGSEKEATFKVHFREFAEVTEKVYPDYAYTVQHSYIGAYNALTSLHNQNEKSKALNVRSIPDIYSSNNSYLQYISYDVPVVEGYAPVYYDLKNVWLGNSGQSEGDPFYVSAYGYDGTLNSYELPESADDENIFKGFQGYNSDSSFLLESFTQAKPKYTGTLLSSTIVKEGTNVIIWKSDDVTTDEDGNAKNLYRINYHSGYAENADGWEMPITVKYVEMNPKDETDIDTTLSALTINGKDADGYKDNTYYVAVSDLATNDGITKEQIVATPTVDGATYEVSEIANNQATLTVTAKDGETTQEYTVKFKQPQKATATLSAITRLTYNNGTYTILDRTSKGYTYPTITATPLMSNGNFIEFIDFSVDSSNDIVITGDMKLSGITFYKSGYEFYSTEYDVIDNTCTFDFLTSDNLLGSMTYLASTTQSITFNKESVKIRNGNKVMIACVDTTSDGSASRLNSPALEVNYITLD